LKKIGKKRIGRTSGTESADRPIQNPIFATKSKLRGADLSGKDLSGVTFDSEGETENAISSCNPLIALMPKRGLEPPPPCED
jgi:hypothetical protein